MLFVLKVLLKELNQTVEHIALMCWNIINLFNCLSYNCYIINKGRLLSLDCCAFFLKMQVTSNCQKSISALTCFLRYSSLLPYLVCIAFKYVYVEEFSSLFVSLLQFMRAQQPVGFCLFVFVFCFLYNNRILISRRHNTTTFTCPSIQKPFHTCAINSPEVLLRRCSIAGSLFC